MPATELLTMAGLGSSKSNSNSNCKSVDDGSEVEAFHRMIADDLSDLASSPEEDLMSLRWIGKLLESFLRWEEEFTTVLLNHRGAASTPPMDRVISDHFERTLKALDVCNAVRDGIDRIRHWHRLLQIVLTALNSNHTGDANQRRAKKALMDLSISMLDHTNNEFAQRHRSFGRNSPRSSTVRHFRSMSWSVSRSWSAAKQIQGMAVVVPSRSGNEGLMGAVAAANAGVVFTMWALVAAVPCQDSTAATRSPITITAARGAGAAWGHPMGVLQDRIMGRRNHKLTNNACGLLWEMQTADTIARSLLPLSHQTQQSLLRLNHLSQTLTQGLDPLERRVRDVFRRIVRTRTLSFP